MEGFFFCGGLEPPHFVLAVLSHTVCIPHDIIDKFPVILFLCQRRGSQMTKCSRFWDSSIPSFSMRTVELLASVLKDLNGTISLLRSFPESLLLCKSCLLRYQVPKKLYVSAGLRHFLFNNASIVSKLVELLRFVERLCGMQNQLMQMCHKLYLNVLRLFSFHRLETLGNLRLWNPSKCKLE